MWQDAQGVMAQQDPQLKNGTTPLFMSSNTSAKSAAKSTWNITEKEKSATRFQKRKNSLSSFLFYV
jgi:hypothetical protein